MNKKGVTTNIIKRIKEIYQETENWLRTYEENSERFWPEKWIKTGLSSVLFSIAYADDVALLAKKPKDEESDKKVRKLRVKEQDEERKVIEYTKRGGRKRKEQWTGKEQKLEQGYKIKYWSSLV